MANPAVPLVDQDATIVVGSNADPDATIMVGGARDADATQVVTAPASSKPTPPSATVSPSAHSDVHSGTHSGGDATRMEFLRKVQARAKAKLKGAVDPTLN